MLVHLFPGQSNGTRCSSEHGQSQNTLQHSLVLLRRRTTTDVTTTTTKFLLINDSTNYFSFIHAIIINEIPLIDA